MKKQFVLGLLFVSLVGICAFLLGSPLAAQKRQPSDATRIVPGPPTQEEKAFSAALAKIYPDREKKRLTLITDEDAGIGIGGIRDFVNLSDAPEITPSRFLANLSCKADVVAAGHIVSKAAHLSDDETFVYTQYDFALDSIIKNQTPDSVKADTNIQVVRPGGDVIINDHHIQVRDFSFEMFTKGRRYLLFLTYVPGAHGFIVMDEGDLELSGDSVRKLSQGPGGGAFKDVSEQLVLTKAREVAYDGCGGTK